MTTPQVKQMESEKSGISADYVVIDMLPTYFRQYSFKRVFVRGLYFEEAKTLSKLVDAYGKEIPLSKLTGVYEDVIRMEGGTLYDLEISDFFALQTISTLNTVEGFGWYPNQPCRQFHEGKLCEGTIKEKFTLEDLEFEDPEITELPLPIKFNGEDIDIQNSTIRDLIEIEKLPEDLKSYGAYAAMWVNSGKSLDERIKAIRFSDQYVGEQFAAMDKALYIGIKSFRKPCDTCRQESEVRIGLNKIKSFP